MTDDPHTFQPDTTAGDQMDTDTPPSEWTARETEGHPDGPRPGESTRSYVNRVAGQAAHPSTGSLHPELNPDDFKGLGKAELRRRVADASNASTRWWERWQRELNRNNALRAEHLETVQLWDTTVTDLREQLRLRDEEIEGLAERNRWQAGTIETLSSKLDEALAEHTDFIEGQLVIDETEHNVLVELEAEFAGRQARLASDGRYAAAARMQERLTALTILRGRMAKAIRGLIAEAEAEDEVDATVFDDFLPAINFLEAILPDGYELVPLLHLTIDEDGTVKQVPIEGEPNDGATAYAREARDG